MVYSRMTTRLTGYRAPSGPQLSQTGKGELSGMDHKQDCFVCGKELVYLDTDERLVCYYCNGSYTSNVRCEGGHYVCDRCHSLTGNDLIEEYCLKTASHDPLEMAISLVKHPQIKMHGPEHHFLVPAVIIAACSNIRKTDNARKEADLKKTRQRAQVVPGGFCGFYGDCGAAVGTGIAVSILTDATPPFQKGMEAEQSHDSTEPFFDCQLRRAKVLQKEFIPGNFRGNRILEGKSRDNLAAQCGPEMRIQHPEQGMPGRRMPVFRFVIEPGALNLSFAYVPGSHQRHPV